MNILFFLIPKHEVAYLEDHFTLRQALEKMENHMYSSLPILNQEGAYIGTISEGDVLWYSKDHTQLNICTAEDTPLLSIPRRTDYTPVAANSNMEDLISKAVNQNFIPVLDDANRFIGIITRKDIIQHCYSNMNQSTK